MDEKRGSGIWRAAAIAVAVFVAWRVFSPSATRDEQPRGDVPGSGPAVDQRPGFLRMPAGMREYGALDKHGAEDHHWYLPYAVVNEDQALAMAEALKSAAAAGNPLPDKLPVPEGRGAAERDMLFRTEPGVWRFYTTDINNPESGLNDADIPVVITPPAPGARSSEVLYLDGHLESVPVGRFPLSQPFLDALAEIDPPPAR